MITSWIGFRWPQPATERRGQVDFYLMRVSRRCFTETHEIALQCGPLIADPERKGGLVCRRCRDYRLLRIMTGDE